MKLIRKNGHAQASGGVPVDGPAQAIGRRTFLRRSDRNTDNADKRNMGGGEDGILEHVGRVAGDHEEVAAMAMFLAGPSAGFITGQAFGVNGGSVMP